MIKTTAALVALVICALLASAPGAASADGVFASASAASKGARVGAASANHRLSILLALRADDAALTAYASAVSNPSSPLYGKYLGPEQIAQRFGSSKADRARVKKALRTAGLTAHTGLGGFWIETEATVAQASALFSTGFASYRARTSGKRFVAPSGKPTLPPSLAGAVTGVVGLSDQPAVKTAALAPLPPALNQELSDKQRALGSSIRGNTGTQAGCAAGRAAGADLRDGYYLPPYTPNQVSSAYGLSSLHSKGLKGQGQRIAVIEIDGFSRSDLLTAGACFGYTPPPTPVKLIGLKEPLPAGTETTLDLQVISASAPGVSSIHVIEGANTNSALVQQFATAIDTPSRYRPSVVSASLGQCEAGQSGQQPFLNQMERTLKSAAAAGISVVVSTGDTGSTGCATGGENDAALPVQSIDYPSSSPWATAVGGTNISLSPANKITEEVVWNDSPTAFGAGTGGYSLFFGKPSWQTGPGVGSGNLVRSTPDIALLADSLPGYPIYCTASECGSAWSPVGGTSAAAPLFASGVLIANQQAKAAGQKQLGFLNQTIYKLAAKSPTRAKVFRDVTKVGNDLGKMIGPSSGGNNTATGCCSATKYYDRASGWGSVNFPSFSYEARKLGGSRAGAVAGSR